MKRKLSLFFVSVLALSSATVFAQSDDDLFGGDDDFFFDDGIEDVADTSARTDLSKGVLFDNGSIKIGGNFDFGISTLTTLYADDDESFGNHLKDSVLTPSASAYLTVDARPTQTLRMYTKFGVAYPYKLQPSFYQNPYTQEATVTVQDWLSLKEIFTDFSIKDTAFFRFGLHTVTWGTGYFFSPVSDMINTSSIDPENTDTQVNGSFNLRTQITFSGSQNCLWFYVIPSTDFINNVTFDSYVRDTALAAKGDIVVGSWEFGVGGFWQYQNAPKAMLTATGSLKNISLFGEFVYSYGADTEWEANMDWDDKTSIFQATAGLSRYWKNQNILLAAQYYYDGNSKDSLHQYFTYGHNIAAMAQFGRLFGRKDITATVFGMANFGREEMPELIKSVAIAGGLSSAYFSSMTLSGMMYFSPINELTFGAGPYITWTDFESAPNVALKLSATLGGGKF